MVKNDFLTVNEFFFYYGKWYLHVVAEWSV